MFKRLVSLFSAKSPGFISYRPQSVAVKSSLPQVNNNLLQELLFPFLRVPELQKVPIYAKATYNGRFSRFQGFNRQNSRHYSLLLKPSLSQTFLSQRFNNTNNNPIFSTILTGNLFQKFDSLLKLYSSLIPFPYFSLLLNNFSSNISNTVYAVYDKISKNLINFKENNGSANEKRNDTSQKDINISASVSYAKRIRDLIDDHRLPSVSTELLGSSIHNDLGCKIQFKHYPNNDLFTINDSYLLNHATMSKISNDIDHQIKELTLLKNQLSKIHSNLGMLPFSFQVEDSSILVSFPNSTVKEVELLLLDLGVTRGFVIPSFEEGIISVPASSSPMTASSSDASSWCSCISEREFFVDVPVVNKKEVIQN